MLYGWVWKVVDFKGGQLQLLEMAISTGVQV